MSFCAPSGAAPRKVQKLRMPMPASTLTVAGSQTAALKAAERRGCTR